MIRNDSLARGNETVILSTPLIIPEFSNFWKLRFQFFKLACRTFKNLRNASKQNKFSKKYSFYLVREKYFFSK